MNIPAKLFILLLMIMSAVSSCKNQKKQTSEVESDFKYFVDQFDDMRVLKYQVPGFELLSLQQKKLIYYLSEAALSGRDILWAQNFKYNLKIRKTFEAIIVSYKGDRESADYKAFLVYAKRVFFANGIHHHYSNDKLKPGFPDTFLSDLVMGSDPALLPLAKDETPEKLIKLLSPVIFNISLYPRKIESRAGADLVTESATNLYEGVNQKEVEAYYKGKADPKDSHPISIGLNSRVVKKDGKIVEEVYKSGGLYGEAIDKIIIWLEKAQSVAETDVQKKEFGLLIDYYRSGELKKWDDYNVVWAKNIDPVVDYNNGFIETYGDPLGMKATWEAIVNFKDMEATKRTDIISTNAQWFEDNSPIEKKYKKEKVTGIAAKVINIAMLGGDCYPAAPFGINLPNADWIRKEVGSKSVSLANITQAYDEASKNSGFLDEFSASKEEIERSKKFGSLADALHTDLHECVGHASGKLAEGTDPNALKNYASTLEEARADLFALYFLMDNKILDLKLLPDLEAGRSEYDGFIRNGLMTQLVRIKPGKDIEEAHMRDRALIAHWVYEKGKSENVIETFRREGKSYVKINDYRKLQTLFGELLKELQRIKSEGDFEAGKKLVEDFGVKVDGQLHKELLERYEKLHLAPYTGFVNPKLVPVLDANGEITDVKVECVDDYLSQMMNYGKEYSFLTPENK
jgi:dipeptidyl-peptidase III